MAFECPNCGEKDMMLRDENSAVCIDCGASRSYVEVGDNIHILPAPDDLESVPPEEWD